MSKLTPEQVFEALATPDRDGYMAIQYMVNHYQTMEVVINRLISEQLMTLFGFKNNMGESKLASAFGDGRNLNTVLSLISQHISDDDRDTFLKLDVGYKVTIGDMLDCKASSYRY